MRDLDSFRRAGTTTAAETSPLDWMGDALCQWVDPALWETGASSEETRAAKAICHECPVQVSCLAYALDREQPGYRYGIYGGLTANQRTRYVRGTQQDVA